MAVLVAAGCGAYLILNDDNGDDGLKLSGYPGSYLAVLGNADLDLDIDADDVAKINEFVSGDVGGSDGYDYKDYYMYDANNDGKIDAADAKKVSAMIAAQSSNDWSAVKKIYYVNVDYRVVGYDMTLGDKVITLIAPPLDSVLAMGGKDLVVGTDNRITTGKYHAEYAKTFDFSKLTDVGSCNEPDMEKIISAADEYGSINVVCGTADAYGPTMEDVFAGTDVQVIRIASWEYGETLYGFMTLGYLLKLSDKAKEYYDWYQGVHGEVMEIVGSVGAEFKERNGTSCAYCYFEELSLLGRYSGEYENLKLLGLFDSTESFLNNGNSGGHGNSITNEDVVSMYQKDKLRYMVLMLGAPFQMTVDSDGNGNGQATQVNIKNLYQKWGKDLGTDTMDGFQYCIVGYSFSSGVAEVLNQLIQCYYVYHDKFLAHFECADDKAAQDKLAEYVDAYCKWIGIDDMWSFYGEANGGAAGTYGMNLLYAGEGDARNIMYGPESGVLKL